MAEAGLGLWSDEGYVEDRGVLRVLAGLRWWLALDVAAESIAAVAGEEERFIVVVVVVVVVEVVEAVAVVAMLSRARSSPAVVFAEHCLKRANDSLCLLP